MPIFTPKRRITARNSGNVLFIILIAVMLFGALSFVVTKTSKTSGDSGVTKEQAKLAASELLSYGQAVERAVTRILSRGTSEQNLDFNNAAWLTNGGAAVTSTLTYNCTSDSCRVFNAAGGGATALAFPQYGVPSTVAAHSTSTSVPQPGHARIMGVIVQGVGSALPDIVLLVSYLYPSVCSGINTALGIANDADGTPPLDDFATTVAYTAGSVATTTGIIGDVATQFVGKTAGCVRYSSSAGETHFYQVLVAR